MKKIWKIAIVLTFALLLTASLIACNDDDFVYVYETDANGETVTDEAGEPVKEIDDDGNPVTAPDEDGDGVADDLSNQTESTGNIIVEGVDTDTGWGEIITPNK